MSKPELIKTAMPEDSRWIFHFRPFNRPRRGRYVVPALVSGRREGQNSCGAFHQTHARLHRIEALLPVRIASFRPIATAPKIEVPSTLPPSGSSVGTHLDQKMIWSFGACSSHKKRRGTADDCVGFSATCAYATARLDLFDRIDLGTHAYHRPTASADRAPPTDLQTANATSLLWLLSDADER